METLRTGKVYTLELDFLPGKSRKLIYQPIRHFLHSHTYDVVHVHSGSISVLAYVAKAAYSEGIRKIIVHSHATGVPSLKHKIIRFVFGFVLRRNATDFLACSKAAGVMKYPTDVVKKNLVVVKNGVNVDDFRFEDMRRTKIRKKLGIDENVFVVGHVGRFSKEKNHTFLIELFAGLNEQLQDSMLLLVGDGELKDEIKEQIHQRNLDHAILFTGNVDNVVDYYQAMNVFVLPSHYEGLPYVTMEAQATGIPCVISTGVPEAAVIADNVYRLDLNDQQSWIDRLIALKEAKPTDNTNAIRQAGYDVKDTAGQIRSLYLSGESKSIGATGEFDGQKETERGKHNEQEGDRTMRVLEITGEPILHGGQERFIQNLIENIDHENLIIDVLTPYYCENDAFVAIVQNGGVLP